ncbi:MULTISPECIES: dTDP-4-dehydrorhamnose reductase [unclassified Ensifer]|uniref:dTDP-4-dehydrorhamnose reductase n=1 Tax=unclassified Ensifer TaxID=2633371 RepID=UPI0007124F21|nr:MULTISPECIES: dTDP-4-dehydrorhamnose reductase [unclassified Ensifer]KQX44821.1 dTDP-4-dehydrorhamnose reductase [Ensifer sp. Root1298]KQX76663.1 dTDP-4-dehydrorhamnose reductase [Ensifer sp. Root1312]KRC17175.1 dTDP-4-dehydrorhamnose reductase [Ensifer sp. Root74]KRD62205.1 dTDP-4-dehydrorhamnose reductase [Ensifer sp. Root954]
MNQIPRIVVTGLKGQVVQSFVEQGNGRSDFEVIPLGRPQLDLKDPSCIDGVIRAAAPDVIISAAAYTAVDHAEADETRAYAINAVAPQELARVAKALNIPIIHLSTDYVFDGTKSTPYTESDRVCPVNVYGKSKWEGERTVAAGTDNHVILRTAWVYSPFGKNFVRTIIRNAQGRTELPVVMDQAGNPTSALDLATAIFGIAKNLLASDEQALRGTFHLAGTGDASWADLAEEILALSQELGGPSAKVNRILATGYPTAAARPSNSRLNCSKIARHHGISLPYWKSSIEATVRRVVQHRTDLEVTK